MKEGDCRYTLSDQIGKIKAGIFCFINWNTNLRQLFDL